MIKDESFFIDMETEYSATIIKANSNKNLISGKRTVEIRILVSSGSERKKLINALLVPNNAKNLASVSNLEQQTLRSSFAGL